MVFTEPQEWVLLRSKISNKYGEHIKMWWNKCASGAETFLDFLRITNKTWRWEKSSLEYLTFTCEDKEALNLEGSVLPREPSENTFQFHGGGLVERKGITVQGSASLSLHLSKCFPFWSTVEKDPRKLHKDWGCSSVPLHQTGNCSSHSCLVNESTDSPELSGIRKIEDSGAECQKAISKDM